MRSRLIAPLLLLLAVALACSNGKARRSSKASPKPLASETGQTPTIPCDAVLPPLERERLLPGHAVIHERSCHDGRCFADTCLYRKHANDKGVQVLYDCRAEVGTDAVRVNDYFSTARRSARSIAGLGENAAIDDEGLTFFDGDADCLVTIRSDRDEDVTVELARAIEARLSAEIAGR